VFVAGKNPMKRRDFIAVLGVTVASTWSRGTRAQQSDRTRLIGVLWGLAESDPEAMRRTATFRDGLRDLGWIEGRNIRMDIRWGNGDVRRMQAHAEELASLKPDLLLGSSTPTLKALHQATGTVPIVFVSVSDPVGDGFVRSLQRPGGNITGFSNYDPAIAGKWLEFLKDIAPRTERVGIVFNPDTAPHSLFLPALRSAAAILSLEIDPAPVTDTSEIDKAAASFGRGSGHALVVLPDSFTFGRRDLITAVAARHQLPAIYPFRVFTAAGGLLSYGVDLGAQYRPAAGYVSRILNGEKPADLPVQAPTKFELVINLRSAKALGLNVPPTLLARADEVIE
jgi:putative ABC transport system substrate-binding protein